MITQISKFRILKQICRKELYCCLISAVVSFSSPVCLGQSVDANLEAQVRAAYIYNFTKFFDWGQNNSEFFTVIILGKSKVTDLLYKIADKEKVNGNPLIVNEVSALLDLDLCNILYLPTSDKDILNDTLKKIKGKKVLLVTNSTGFAEKGAGINFVLVGGKIKFEINRKTIEKAGIIPNSSILSVAYKVYE